MKTNRTIVVVGIVVIIVLIGLGIWIGVSFISSSSNPSAASPYSAVFLTTGDIYYGKLSWFPNPHITDAWVLQQVKGANGQTQLGVVPFTSSFWGPVNEIDLNPNDIVFWTRLRNDSQLAQALANPSSVNKAGGVTGISPSSTFPLPASSSAAGTGSAGK